MNQKKKLVCYILSFIFIFALCSTTTYAATSKSWNMGNTEFKNLGTISSTVNVDGLNLVATSEKTMSVIASNVTLGTTEFKYALALGGGGSTSYRAVSLPVSGSSTLKITAKSSGSDTRYLKVVTSKGVELGTIDCTSSVALGTLTMNVTDTIYIYSTGSGINIYKVQLDSSDSVPSGNSTTVTNFAGLVSAAKTMASTSGGGTIYVNASKLTCTAQLALSSTTGNPVAIVGVKQSDGTYPVLDFTSFRTEMVGNSIGSLAASSDSSVGVRISGSQYTIKNLIIEKAPDNGIQIKGSSANNNSVENCILRYNNDAGLQITGGASNNSIRFVYSYRNCDVYTRGGNADGFAPKLGAGTGNKFYGCYAWENSDDGWDSYDKTTGGYTYDLSYEECAVWNNGDPTIFTGEYDYKKGNALDKNLFLVELITKQSSSFATNYSSGKFSLPTGNILKTDAGTISLANWVGTNYGGNPNGFKFGSVYSGADLKRTVKNCLSFGHASKGFDNNNSACTASFKNTISFDNKYNYYFPLYTLTGWSSVQGFSGSSSDKLPSGYSVTTPSSSKQSTIRSTVTSTVKTIVDQCNSNKIPGEVYFNIYN